MRFKKEFTMKLNKRIYGLFLSLLIICSLALAAVGCGGAAIQIIFDYNYEGAPEAYVLELKEGDGIDAPAEPTREGYLFEGWFTDKAATEEADFGYGASADATFYAGWTKTEATVTFAAGYVGGNSTTASVNIGGTVSQPNDPERVNYLFTGWFTDEDCTKQYDFSTKINGDITLYAGWEENAGDTVKVTFAYNYDGAGNYYTTRIKTGRRVAQPATPVRERYAFLGWYTDKECTASFSFTSNIREDITLYAYWLKEWSFEAEYTDVSGIHGHGYSGEFDGTDIILRDTKNKGASNNFFVSFLYGASVELIFEINAAEAVENAVLELSLTAEQGDVVLTPDNYTVKVNDQALTYGGISMTGAESAPDKMLNFKRYNISMTVSLNKGNNVIKLITSNNVPMKNGAGEAIGTMYATAPVVDCLYLYTDVTLSWAEGKCYTSNINGK